MSAPSAANSSTPADDPLKPAVVSTPASSGGKSGEEPEVHDDDDDDDDEKKKKEVDYPSKKLKDSHSDQIPATTTSSQSAPSSSGVGSDSIPTVVALEFVGVFDQEEGTGVGSGGIQSLPSSSAGGSQTAPSSAAIGGLDSIPTGLAMVLVSTSDRFNVAGPAGSSDDESGSDSGSDSGGGASIESPPVSGASGLTDDSTNNQRY